MIYLKALMILIIFLSAVGLISLWGYFCIYKLNSPITYLTPLLIGLYFFIVFVLKGES